MYCVLPSILCFFCPIWFDTSFQRSDGSEKSRITFNFMVTSPMSPCEKKWANLHAWNKFSIRERIPSEKLRPVQNRLYFDYLGLHWSKPIWSCSFFPCSHFVATFWLGYCSWTRTKDSTGTSFVVRTFIERLSVKDILRRSWVDADMYESRLFTFW